MALRSHSRQLILGGASLAALLSPEGCGWVLATSSQLNLNVSGCILLPLVLLWKQRSRVPSVPGTSKESAVILTGTLPALPPQELCSAFGHQPLSVHTWDGVAHGAQPFPQGRVSTYRAWTGAASLRALGSCGSSVSDQEPSPLDLPQALHVGLFILPQAPPLTRARVRCPENATSTQQAVAHPALPCSLSPAPVCPGRLALDLTHGTRRLERWGEGTKRTGMHLWFLLFSLFWEW